MTTQKITDVLGIPNSKYLSADLTRITKECMNKEPDGIPLKSDMILGVIKACGMEPTVENKVLALNAFALGAGYCHFFEEG